MESKFFPVFIDINNKNILVIGAGKIAFRKVSTLLEYGANIHIITKDISDHRFLNLSENFSQEKINRVRIEEREFEEKDLENKFMVISATDDKNFNKYIYQLCNQKNILINNITSKTDMNTRFCSIIENESYQIGISAKGNPTKAKELKKKLGSLL